MKDTGMEGLSRWENVRMGAVRAIRRDQENRFLDNENRIIEVQENGIMRDWRWDERLLDLYSGGMRVLSGRAVSDCN